MSRQSDPALQGPASPPEAGTEQDPVIETWLGVRSALVPVIGQGGFASLYQRCLHLALLAHPWLSKAKESGDDAFRFELLRQALSQQRPEQAAEAQVFLLRTLLNVLTNLIGASLVHRLLGSVVSVSPTIPPEHSHP